MLRRFGFTMLELIFVIVIMGILGKFGVEFIAQAYRNFIYASVNHNLQVESEMAVEFIASRLQFRIKDSIIARKNDGDLNHFKALGSSDYGSSATVLEWVGSDMEGFRGDLNTTPISPNWSAIIDLRDAETNATQLKSPETNTTQVNKLIDILSDSGSDVNDTALYFVGSDSNVRTGYGWDGNALTDQNGTMHPVRQSSVAGKEDIFIPINGSTGADNNFSGVDVYEYYQLVWSAYAIEHNTTTGDLILHYDYQPWRGEDYLHDGKSQVIMENVSTFRFKAVGSVVKIQVCVKSNIIDGGASGGYSLCKEKTVF
jgi:prepilin-type N-terminal cleavage/methylation domain-containing protein